MFRAAVSRLIYLGILFLAGVVLSNIALPEKFGILSLLILNTSILIVLTGFGIDSMVLYKLSNKLWHVSQAFQFVWKGIFLQVIIFGFLEFGYWMVFHRTLLCNAGPDYFVIEACYFIGFAIVEKYLSLFYAQNRPEIVNRILATVALFYLLLLLLIYYVIHIKWMYVLYLFAFQNLAQGFLLIILFKPGDEKSSNLQTKDVFGALKMSSIVMITNVIQLLAYRMDFWLLDYFYGNYEVGIYAQANKFANFSWLIPNIVSQILIPKFALMQKDRSAQLFSLAFWSNFIIILLTIIFAQSFYLFYLNPEYKLGMAAFFLMLPGYFFWASVIYIANYFSAKGKFVYNLIGSLLCFVLISVADIILIPGYGIEGAGLANTIAYSLVFIIYLFILMKKESFRWNDLLLPRKKSLFDIVKQVSR